MDLFLEILFSKPMIVGIIVAISASLLGVFVILRKMALVGDALSHVALPGFAIALLYNFNPFIGAFAFLIIGVLLIVYLEKVSAISIETITGVLFTASLAIGLLLIKDEGLIESLFGDISKINNVDVAIALILGLLIIIFTIIFFNKFLKISISYDLAKSEQINVSKINVVFLLLLAASVALGIKVVGALLMGAMVILPATAAKNISSTIKLMTLMSIIFGIFMALSGISISSNMNFPAGPIIVLIGTFLFLLSILIRFIKIK